MVTKISVPIKRELLIDRTAYVLSISNIGFTLTLKGKRKGLEIGWHSLISGDEAIAVALRASLEVPIPHPQVKKRTKTKKRRP